MPERLRSWLQGSEAAEPHRQFGDRVRRTARIAGITAVALLLAAAALASYLWQDRAVLAALPIDPVARRVPPVDALTATWFGTSTLLFDDGETQILIDGFVSRPTLFDQLLDRPVASDAAAINDFMLDNRLDRLAAIIPAHTHFDHAFDVGAIANRSRASIIGSPSAVLLGRGAGVPDDQLVAVGNRATFSFGEFTVTLLAGRHAGFGWNGSVPRDGAITRPLEQPAAPSEYRADVAYTVVLAHPQGTAIVQASAGAVSPALAGFQADVLFLGVGMLESLGRDYAERYWIQTVTATGAARVFPIHFDDFTRPFGVTELLPRALDDFVRTAGWLLEFQKVWDRDATLELPVFGEPITLYAGDVSTGI